ncbi:MAG: hypothetical protein DRH17_11575 [Deltaproteobacteria bacterium]|nr:MAG: hypothetical protein DRH17_11575 [Deltaproteobacteria bacterium]
MHTQNGKHLFQIASLDPAYPASLPHQGQARRGAALRQRFAWREAGRSNLPKTKKALEATASGLIDHVKLMWWAV